MVLHRSRQRRWLVDDQYVIFIVLAQVLLSKIEAFHAGDLQLKHRNKVVSVRSEEHGPWPKTAAKPPTRFDKHLCNRSGARYC